MTVREIAAWYISNTMMTIATVLATIPVFFSDGTPSVL